MCRPLHQHVCTLLQTDAEDARVRHPPSLPSTHPALGAANCDALWVEFSFGAPVLFLEPVFFFVGSLESATAVSLLQAVAGHM